MGRSRGCLEGQNPFLIHERKELVRVELTGINKALSFKLHYLFNSLNVQHEKDNRPSCWCTTSTQYVVIVRPQPGPVLTARSTEAGGELVLYHVEDVRSLI